MKTKIETRQQIQTIFDIQLFLTKSEVQELIKSLDMADNEGVTYTFCQNLRDALGNALGDEEYRQMQAKKAKDEEAKWVNKDTGERIWSQEDEAEANKIFTQK